MRRAVAADWAYGSSVVHRRDPRVKLVTLLGVLAGITTAARSDWATPALLAAALLAVSPLCDLPPFSLALRALTISLFALPFAVLIGFDTGAQAGAALWLRAFACATAVLLVAGTTRLPDLMAALRWFRMPRLLSEVIQFVYRYVFLAGDQAHRMRTAAAARGGLSFEAAGGVLAVLFARSYQRAENIHRAMLSRGYNGSLPHTYTGAPGIADAALLVAVLLGTAAIRCAIPYFK